MAKKTIKQAEEELNIAEENTLKEESEAKLAEELALKEEAEAAEAAKIAEETQLQEDIDKAAAEQAEADAARATAEQEQADVDSAKEVERGAEKDLFVASYGVKNIDTEAGLKSLRNGPLPHEGPATTHFEKRLTDVEIAGSKSFAGDDCLQENRQIDNVPYEIAGMPINGPRVPSKASTGKFTV